MQLAKGKMVENGDGLEGPSFLVLQKSKIMRNGNGK